MLPRKDPPSPPTWRGSSDLNTGTPVVRHSPLPAVGTPGWAVSLELGPRPHRREGPAVVPHHQAGLRRPLPCPGVPGAAGAAGAVGGGGVGGVGGGVGGHLSGCGRGVK